MCFLLLIIPKFCFHGVFSCDIFQTCLFCGVFVDVSKGCFFVAFPLWQSSLRSLGSTLFPCSKCKKNSCILTEVNHIDSIGKFMLLFVKLWELIVCVFRVQGWLQRYNLCATDCGIIMWPTLTWMLGTRFWFILWAQAMRVFHILKKAIHYTPQNMSVGTPNVQFISMNSRLIAESG